MVSNLTQRKRKENTYVMNFNNYTIKSQETVQQAQQLAQTYGHQSNRKRTYF